MARRGRPSNKQVREANERREKERLRLEEECRTALPEIAALPAADAPIQVQNPQVDPPQRRLPPRTEWFVQEFTLANEEMARRETDGLRLYRPMKQQEAIHRSKAPERLVVAGNRSGKTLASAAEVASAVTGIPITFADGSTHRPEAPERDGIAYLVGASGKHLADVMYKELFKSRAFRVIRDLDTQRWRPYLPDDPRDAGRKRESRWAPPLVPRRLVKSIAWENKAQEVPIKIMLRNGWVLNFFSAHADPQQGTDIDLAWIDEESGGLYSELSARLIDRGGWLLWSATPQAGTEELYLLHERAEEEEDQHVPWAGRSIHEFYLHINDNVHIAGKNRQAFKKKIVADAEYQVRVEGRYLVSSWKVYPEWDENLHLFDLAEVPRDWTRFMVVDPGFQVCAVLFGAVPPLLPAGSTDPLLGDYIYLYRELYLRQCTAPKFGEAVKAAVADDSFEVFIIDEHGARLSGITTGQQAWTQYGEELKKRGVSSRLSGHSFIPGHPNVKDGVTAVKTALSRRPDGTIRVRVLRDRLPNFSNEIKRYRNKRVRDPMGGYTILDEPESRRAHLMDAFRYLVCYNPKYHKPVAKRILSDAERMLRRKQDRERQKYGGDTVMVLA